MAFNKDPERTEKATAKRRQDEREKGNVVKSREVTSVLILFSSLLLFYFTTEWMTKNLSLMMKDILAHSSTLSITSSNIYRFMLHISGKVGLILAPLTIVGIISAITGNVLQFGFLISAEPLKPKASMFNLVNGLKKVVSKQSIMELFKSCFKITIVGVISYYTVKSEYNNFPILMQMDTYSVLAYIGMLFFRVTLRTCIVLIILAVFDYAFQKWEYEENLKMTKKEVKDERKQMEGDPLVKGKIRRLQLDAVRKRMMEAVPKADVVITNPTHYAVALLYERGSMPAPKVVAKGKGYLAQKIKKVAEENDVPLVEDKMLARTLYKTVEIGQYVPENLFKAAAKVLAYVYKLKNRVFGK